ncbi:MAG: NfeD family protein [Candidatus Brocadiae bacterium]|nr:NfeD family protein [Candidatus Brocadiia bacterium]
MSWTWLNWAYTFALTVGTGYTVIAFFLGHFGHGHGADGGDAPEVGGNAGHVGADHQMHFPLLSPVAIAVFLTAFGAGGLVGQELLKGHHPALSLAVASGAGLVFGLTIAAAMGLIMQKTVSTSHAKESDVIGAEASVTVTVPDGGIGKISYEARGARFTAPARAIGAGDIPQGATVVIVERDGAVLVVAVK